MGLTNARADEGKEERRKRSRSLNMTASNWDKPIRNACCHVQDSVSCIWWDPTRGWWSSTHRTCFAHTHQEGHTNWFPAPLRWHSHLWAWLFHREWSRSYQTLRIKQVFIGPDLHLSGALILTVIWPLNAWKGQLLNPIPCSGEPPKGL